ncbi:MAG: hypothetical protein K2N68_01040 [Clostridia bacterium]|nr:hypothetical protein [Clostridia bacterium]
MKYFKKIIISLALALTLCLGCILPACGGGSERLVIEGQKTVFYVGDEFTTGDSVKVYLVKENGQKTDVTDEATFKPESTLDMNVAGSYAVTVSYQNKKEVYFIMVNGFDNVLKRLAVNTADATTTYKVGESISYEGIKVIGTYENAQRQEFDDEITALSTLKFKVTAPDGTPYEDVFALEGIYTVTVSQGSGATTYPVKVAGVNLSSVQNALALGTFFKSRVVGGISTVKSLIKGTWPEVNYSYRFGDNYAYVRQDDMGEISEYHTSIVDDEVDSTYVYNGVQQANSDRKSAEMMEGVYYRPWYNDSNKMAYGIEALIRDMYEIGVANPNKDYAHSENEATKTFGFSFGYLYDGGATRNYYFVVEVSFTLGDSNYIKSAEVLQKAWFSGSVNDKPYANFVTGANGVTKPTKPEPDYQWKVECEQQSGKRTEKNPYLLGDTKAGIIESFQVFYEGQEIKDGDTIKFERGPVDSNGHTKQIVLNFTNCQPSGASFDTDALYVTDGTKPKEDSKNWFYGDDVILIGSWSSGNRTIEAKRGGLITLTFTTENLTMKIYLDVVGSAPKTLTPRVYNPANKLEATVAEKTIGVGETVYFTCIPDLHANGAFTAALTSGVAANVTLVAPKADATADEIAADPTLKYWSFTAAAEGTYVIKMTSPAAQNVSNTITFKVSEIDFASALNGVYGATDNSNGVYTVTFAPAAEGADNGRVTVVYQPAQGDAQETVYDYVVENGAVKLGEPVSGDSMGVSFTVTVENKIILTDKHNNDFWMERSQTNS